MRKRFLLVSTVSVLILIFCPGGLLAQEAVAPTNGDGSSGNPYQIATWQNLYWIAQSTDRWDDFYIQTADIDLSAASPAINTWDSNQGWTPIGNSSTAFTGSYDGQNHFIKGLDVNRPSTDYVGLFGYTSGSGAIQKVGLIDGSVIAQSYVGTLVGAHYSSGTIDYCYNTGVVLGSGYETGGLVGYNYQCTIEYSYNTGTIGNGLKDASGPGHIGGLVGQNHYGTIRNCYNTGKIDGGYWGSGGLVGYNNTDGGVVDKCYSVGLVDACTDPIEGLYRIGGVVGDCCTGTVSNTFWDYETAGTQLGHGTPKTTAEMQDQSTFTNASWDLSTVWAIDSTLNGGYPYLRWAEETVAITTPEVDNGAPSVFTLLPAYPNPFNPSVTLRYGLAEDALTTLKVFNMRGQLVETLVNAGQPAGNYSLVWRPVNLSAGIYLIHLQSENQADRQKVVFVK